MFVDFCGDWQIHLPEMEKAAEANELYHVVLTKEECERLKEPKNFEELKSQTSKLLADKMMFSEDDANEEGEKAPVVIVKRNALCP